MFHDEAQLFLQAGKGGNGSASLRREKFIPKGGPDGGDGGKGGNVLLITTRQLSDLNHLSSVRELKAENGIDGAGRKMYGRAGESLTISLPVGTKVFRKQDNDWLLVTDLVQENTPFHLLSGGEGGLGNVHFATATHQTPREAEPGKPGQSGHFKFELHLIADVGIIGLPNAGKSTFLSVISDAKPKIADYPFTTLSPVLGVVSRHGRNIVFADIPGLIEGAAAGKGLGHTFLRHVERTKILVHFIDSLATDFAKDYQTIRRELSAFDSNLTNKSEIVVITKSELITPDIQKDFDQKITALKKVITRPSILFTHKAISAVTGANIAELLDQIDNLLPKQ